MGPALGFTAAAHLTPLLALLLAASWRIDKLELEDRAVLLSAGVGAPLPEAAAAPAKATELSNSRRPMRHVARRTRDVAQPEKAARDPMPPERQGDRDEGQVGQPGGEGLKLFGSCASDGECTPNGIALTEGSNCGNGRVEPGEECDDGGRVKGDGCSPRCTVERPRLVDARVIEGYRIAGDPQIHPPEPVRDAMAGRGQTRTVAAVEMCLSTGGAVSSLRLQQSTGFPLYDRLLIARMHEWRYRPYRLVDGTPVTACTVVMFIYRIEIKSIAQSRSRTR